MEIRDIGVFLDYFDKIHQRTMRVVRCIPPDRADWSFRQGKFTLGDLARHIAAINRYLFAETVRGNRSCYGGCSKALAPEFDQILDFMEKLHGESAEIISALSHDDLQRKCQTPDGASITTWKWLRAMTEHEVHHRGQIYIYLALLEVPTPPLYGLTSEQVQEYSVKAGS